MPSPADSGNAPRRFDWNPGSITPRQRMVALASFAVIYAALDFLGYGLRNHGALVIIWPASGLMLAALYFMPWRTWGWFIGLQLGAEVAIDYLRAEDFHILWSVMFAAADSLDAIVGALLARRFIPQAQLPRIRQVVAFFGAAAVGSGASAVLGAFCAVNVLSDASYLHQWQLWWAGNWLGSLAITPVALAWAVRWRLPELSVRAAPRAELLICGALLLGMTTWIFSASTTAVTTFLQLPSILLVLLVIAVFRLPPRWSTTLAAAAVLLAAYLSSRGLGPFAAEPNLFTRIGGLQLFLATLVVVTFMLSTVLLEKERTFGALVLSEERYRQFVAHSSEAVWRVELAQPMSMGLLSTEARINWLKQYAHVAECNLSYQQLHKAEGIGDSDHSLWRADVPWAAVYLQHLDTAARQGYSMDGLRFTLQTPNGAEVYLTNFSGIVEDGRLLRIWGVARNITEISDLTDRLRREQERLQAYARQIIGAEERARRTMAVSLHDGVDQQLAELGSTMGAMSSQAPPGLRLLIDGVRGKLGNVQEHTRKLIADVSPPGLYDIGLGAALQWLAVYMRGRDRLAVALTVRIDESELLIETRVRIFQVIRELLRNVALHAKVDSAEVIVGHSGDEVIVEVNDNGTGFDWQYDLFTTASRGFGLYSVADRVHSANGRFSVDTAPGKGCRVTVHFPVKWSGGVAAETRYSVANRGAHRRLPP
jgi:signal transduction histidine kinase